jgi:Dullard-like phosphatase family protein
MVKSSKVSQFFSGKKNLIEILRQTLEKLIPHLNLSTLKTFIPLLLKYSKLLPTCRTIENAYTILFICIIIEEKNPSFTKDSKISPLILEILSKIFNFHHSKLILTSKCHLFKITQEILNNSAKIIQSKQELLREIPEIFYCCQLLQTFASVPFDLSLNSILKFLTGKRKASIFSFFTNDSIPVLPATSEKRKTLVLDLDETLGHFDGKAFLPRPGVQEFISRTSKRYELVLFTSAQEAYANAALSSIDQGKKITFRLYRQHLIVDEGKVVKDLRVLGRGLENVIIVDNEPKYFRNQLENGIQIKSWLGSKDDKELSILENLLCESFEENTYELVKRVNEIINN